MIKKIIFSLILVGYLHSPALCAQQGKVDISFNTVDDGQKGDGFDNIVRTVSLQSDQKLIVGGDYLSLNGISTHYLTRLNLDGSIDETWNTGTGFNGKVYTSYIQPDGKIIVGGSFTSFNGISSGRLIRLNSDGTYDSTFDTTVAATAGIIYNICPQSDGKIIITGSFTKYNNSTVNRVARVLSNGSLDPSFITGSGSSANITNAIILPDGKILLTGNFTVFNTIAANRIVCLLPNGKVDIDFNVGMGFNDDVNTIVIQSNGKIILGGKFTSYNGFTANRIIRLNRDGSIDNDFIVGSGFSGDAVEVIKNDSNGNIMVGGSFTGFYNGTAVNRICLLNSNGILQTDFGIDSGPGSGSVLALANDTENSWYVAGSFSAFDSLNQGRLVKINGDGEHVEGYLSAGVGFDSSVLNVLPLSDKKTLVLGNFRKFNGNFSSRIARVLADGTFDATFNSGQSGANNGIRSGILQSDGKIIFGGNFTKYNEITCNRIVRILPDGAIDNTFNIGSGFNGLVYAIAIQSDEKVIVAGNFTSYNGAPAGRIIRLLQNGLRDVSFNTGVGVDGVVETIVVQPDDKIIVGGRFNSFNGNASPRLVRLNSNGSVDSGFKTGIGFDKNVYTIGLQSDQKIVVGGSFLSYNGISQKRITRLNRDGSLDVLFENGTGFSKGDVRSILIQPDDRILVGGTFSGTYKSNTALRLLRLKKSGDYDSSFESQLNNSLFAMGFTPDYKLIIGGNFNSISGVSKHRIARIKLCLDATVWDGGIWSNGFPSGGKEIEFKGDYENLTSANVCSCVIDKGKKVTLLNGNTLGIELLYAGEGILTMEDSASLYQSDDDIVNTGVVHLKRNSTPIRKSDYTYWSSPVDLQKLIEVSPKSHSEKFYSYNYEDKKWNRENPTNIMLRGRGYIIQGPQDFSTTVPLEFEATFKGIPSNGKIEIKLGIVDSFNLIGNPYPSSLNADVFLAENKSKIKGTLYFWTHNTPLTNYKYTSDDYAVYNLLGGVGTRKAIASGINETVPDGTISSGQAFFVNSKGPMEIEFNNSMRLMGRNSTFFKQADKISDRNIKNAIEKHRIWLNFQNDDGIFKQILIGYIGDATNSYDIDYDAESINGNQFVNFYSRVESKNLVIQARALPFVQTDSIPLGYETTVAGKFSISIDHQDEFFKKLNVFVEDKDLKIKHNLSHSSYSFATQPGTFNERLVLSFIDESLLRNGFEDKKQDIFISVQDRVVKVTSIHELISEIIIFDILGKQLYQKENIENLEFQGAKFNSNNQVLILKIKLKNGKMITRKILL
ncbi:T9SS sorting signal type C domain-containing protein [Flavobacterium collinsii]|uniref:T9SS sorting signal type C domain-containing protein n=1 Tax=Flavobacterium collinsii TaxID=1114861 RepID=UPI002491DE91|nr:T9SS sorting signal type C domain-containing protein [Flavobacterium collinsii]